MTTERFQNTFRPLATIERRRLVRWLVLSVFAALLVYFGFRGYMSSDMLFHFANGLFC